MRGLVRLERGLDVSRTKAYCSMSETIMEKPGENI